MKPLRTIIVVFVFFLGILIYKNSEAADWQEKPIVCMQWHEVEIGLTERGEILLSQGIQTTTVRDVEGYSEVPVFLPLSIYVDPKTKTYTILEYHPGYETYCVISYGQEFGNYGEKT